MYRKHPFGTSDNDDFGNLLAMLRSRAKLSQLSLARLIGVSDKTIQHWENATSTPKATHLKKLIEVYLHLGSFTSGNEQVEAKWLWEKADLNAAFDDAWFLEARGETRQSGKDHSIPPAETRYVPKNNLPAQLTSLIGRTQEVAAVCALMRRPEVRLLTLTGIGGVGKTRLGLQIATELLNDFADGVCFVSLASINDPHLVTSAISHTLGLREAGNWEMSERLQTHLREKHLLVLVDNFEQVVAAAPQLSELLAVCPGLKILVTSRAVLHVRGEYVFEVAPLALPDLRRIVESEALLQYAAVALFLQRAQAIKPDFQMTADNASAIAKICVRLDGLPLAIELAAARITLLPPQALLNRLVHRFEVLTSGARDVPARHQTLQNTIEWSYHLLDAQEQRLLQRLSIFVGGCTLSAIEAVCATPENGTTSVLDVVASLIDKSLLQQTGQEGEEPRLQLLETVREYGLERLKEGGEMEITRQAYTTYYLGLAEKAELYLSGAEQESWLEQLEREHDNLREVLSWLIEQAMGGEAQLALRLGVALRQFWMVRGHLNEGQTFLERALTASEGCVTTLRAKVLKALGRLTTLQGNFGQAEALYVEGLALFRELGDTQGIVESLGMLGYIAMARSNYAAARVLAEEALILSRAEDYTRGIAFSLGTLGSLAFDQGEYVMAHSLGEESLALYRDIGDAWNIAGSLWFLALVTFSQGDPVRARSLGEESLELYTKIGDKRGIAYASVILGYVACLQSEYDTAILPLSESLVLYREVGDLRGTVWGLYGLGWVAFGQSNYASARARFEECLRILLQKLDYRYMLFIASALEGLAQVVTVWGLKETVTAQEQLSWAARLWGVAESLRKTIGAPMLPIARIIYDQIVAAARAYMGEEALATAWDEGRTMSLDQVLTSMNQR